jgi:hypothetical protein
VVTLNDLSTVVPKVLLIATSARSAGRDPHATDARDIAARIADANFHDSRPS